MQVLPTMATFTININLVLLLCTPFLCSLAAATGTVFDVLHYGAKADGKTDNTKAFQEAWREACACTGDNMLLIPKGEFVVGQIIFAGPCKSPVHFQLEGTIKATTYGSDYKVAEWIAFEKIEGFTLTGGGTFDGQGESVWRKNDCKIAAHCPSRSVNIKFRHVTNGKLEKITSLNPKGFHMCINNCHNFIAHDIKIIAPGTSPNTDGMHISHSSDVNITSSTISTGDDCISIIQGDTRIFIRDVTCGPGHGISVGSLGKYDNEDDVKGIYVTNCTLSNTDNGVRVKTWRGAPPSAATDIYFDDIIMHNVKNPVIIDQEYCATGRSCRGNQPSKVKLSNIHFTNIRGTSSTQCAVKMKCSPEVPCEGVELTDIDLKFGGNATVSADLPVLSECANIKVGAKGVQIPKPCGASASASASISASASASASASDSDSDSDSKSASE